MIIQQCKAMVTMQKHVQKWFVRRAYFKLLSATIFIQYCWKQKLAKKGF